MSKAAERSGPEKQLAIRSSPTTKDLNSPGQLSFAAGFLNFRKLGRRTAGVWVNPAATDLENWLVFETANPDCFSGMYQFWLQKAP